MIKVSVVISSYNYGRFLKDAVGSVLSQTYPHSEVLIVNDGSKDDTAEVAERLRAANPDKVVVINQENQGASAARNTGIQAARGEYIVSLDGDDMIKPEFLENTVGVLEENPNIGIAYTAMELFGNIQDIANRIIVDEEYNFKRLLFFNHIPSCNLFRKAAWEKVGGYKKLIGAEDWELWISMGEAGFGGRLINKPLYLHRVHGTSKFDITSSRFGDVNAEIRGLHMNLYYPGLYRLSPTLAKIAHQIKIYLRDPIALYLYRRHPRLHASIKRAIECGLCTRR
jgi:glycosyltransferase involved in cell wall biosynthesis